MHFIKLIRPLNLLVIWFTMYSCRWFVLWFPELMSGNKYSVLHENERIYFALLTFSVVLIAAAGNIINDYFDVKADRINKPNRLIVGKFIKPRWAIVSHVLFNVVALAIGAYLSIVLHSVWYVFCHLITINCLWFYSSYYKRKPLFGNLIVALLTAIVPLLTAYYMYNHYGNISDYSNARLYALFEMDGTIKTSFHFWYFELHNKGIGLIILGFTAFFANLSREIIKDMEDVEGDKLIHAYTLPMIFGVKGTKRIVTLLLATLIAFYFLLLVMNSPQGIWHSLYIMLPVAMAIAGLVLAALVLLKAITRSQLKKSDFIIKISFLLALLQPIYWYILFK